VQRLMPSSRAAAEMFPKFRAIEFWIACNAKSCRRPVEGPGFLLVDAGDGV
jgi:hypothetical protein